jgi:hypothetical protein
MRGTKTVIERMESADRINELDRLLKEREDLLGNNARLTREVEQLNKALALKLDAMPSGLSAGQSKKLESKLAFYIEACAAHQSHIDELQASFTAVGDKLIQTERERDQVIMACAKKTELLRAVRYSMDREVPFPSLEKISEAIDL